MPHNCVSSFVGPALGFLAAFCALPLMLGSVAEHRETNLEGGNPQTTDAVVSGHVYNADTDAPLAGATVAVYPCELTGISVSLKVITLVDGSYIIPAPSCYRAIATAAGFVREEYQGDARLFARPLELTGGKRLDNFDFRLEVAAVISGLVVDAKNQPIARMEVQALQQEFSPRRPHINTIQWVLTNENGEFSLDALPRGDYHVCASPSANFGGVKGPAPGWTYHKTCYLSAASFSGGKEIHAETGKETGGIRLKVDAEKSYTIVAEIQDPSGDDKRRHYLPSLLGAAEWNSAGHENTITIPQIFPGVYTLVVTARDADSGDKVGEGSKTFPIVDSDVHVTISIEPSK